MENEECPICEGSGQRIWSVDPIPCDFCKGTGIIPVPKLGIPNSLYEAVSDVFSFPTFMPGVPTHLKVLTVMRQLLKSKFAIANDLYREDEKIKNLLKELYESIVR